MRSSLLLVLALCVSVCLCAHATSSSMEVSPRMQQLLRDEHALMANGTLKATTTSLGATVAYDYATATQLFWHSVSAYCTDNPNLHSWTCTSCQRFGAFKITQVMDDTTNQGYVGWFSQGLPTTPVPGTVVGANEPFVVVSFRGTVPSNLADWIEDLSFSKQAAFSSSYPSVSVHSGFWGAYQNMKPKMLQGLAIALSDSGARTIIVTGHSLGAAIAELAALDLKLNVYPDKYFASYTQGTPRPGNPAFATLYSQKISASFREIHRADIVPHLPPMALGFQHGPVEVWFDEAWDSYTVCSGTNGEDSKCADSLLLPVSIPDHLTYRGTGVGTFCNAGKQAMQDVEMKVPKQVEQQQMDPQIVLSEF